MTPENIEAILQNAFEACHTAGCPLDTQQREILFRMVLNQMVSAAEGQRISAAMNLNATALENDSNPLDQLTPEQRQALLEFIQAQKRQNLSWKAQLLNDWLHDRNSGAIQFIRDLYGLNWLERVEPRHVAQYAHESTSTLRVGDRIEVSNGLWEWVQDEGPCQREWFPCVVVSLTEVTDATILSSTGYSRQTNCTIRFDNGMEYEIQGIYEWNRYNWRWTGGESQVN